MTKEVIDSLTLLRFVENDLPREERERVRNIIQTNPIVAHQLNMLLETQKTLSMSFKNSFLGESPYSAGDAGRNVGRDKPRASVAFQAAQARPLMVPQRPHLDRLAAVRISSDHRDGDTLERRGTPPTPSRSKWSIYALAASFTTGVLVGLVGILASGLFDGSKDRAVQTAVREQLPGDPVVKGIKEDSINNDKSNSDVPYAAFGIAGAQDTESQDTPSPALLNKYLPKGWEEEVFGGDVLVGTTKNLTLGTGREARVEYLASFYNKNGADCSVANVSIVASNISRTLLACHRPNTSWDEAEVNDITFTGVR